MNGAAEDIPALATAGMGNAAHGVSPSRNAKNLGGLLGNPQTLGIIADVASATTLPAGIGALFDQFVKLAWCETNDRKPDTALQGLGKAAVLDALGAALPTRPRED